MGKEKEEGQVHSIIDEKRTIQVEWESRERREMTLKEKENKKSRG